MMTMVNLMTMMMTTCMIKLRMMVGPGKVDGQHVARYPVVEEPQQQRLPGIPVDDEDGGGVGDTDDTWLPGFKTWLPGFFIGSKTWLPEFLLVKKPGYKGFLLVQKPGCKGFYWLKRLGCQAQGFYWLKIKPGCEG